MDEQPFLTYRFQGFKFEFIRDYIRVTNERYIPYQTYKISLIDYKNNPFIIEAE